MGENYSEEVKNILEAAQQQAVTCGNPHPQR